MLCFTNDCAHNYFYRDKHKIIKESSYTDCHWLLITEDKMMGDEEKLVLRLDLPCLTFSHKCPLASRFLLHGLLQQLDGEPSPWFKWASGPDTPWSNCQAVYRTDCPTVKLFIILAVSQPSANTYSNKKDWKYDKKNNIELSRILPLASLNYRACINMSLWLGATIHRYTALSSPIRHPARCFSPADVVFYCSSDWQEGCYSYLLGCN